MSDQIGTAQSKDSALDQDLTSFSRAMGVYRRSTGTARFGKTANSRRTYISRALLNVAEHAAEKGLREHQGDAVRAVAAQVADFDKPPLALVTIPTAGGKTRAFQTIVSALGISNSEGVRHMPNVVVLVPTRVLIRQTFIEFKQHFPTVEVVSASPTRMYDDDDAPIPIGVAPVTLMTYSAFTRAAENGSIVPDDIDLLVMDEAHRGLSDLRQATLQPFLNHCVVSAWTATPAFDEEKNVQNLLGPENEVYSISPQELRDRGVIAPIINYVMAVAMEGAEPENSRQMLALKRKALVESVMDFVEHHIEHDLGIELAGKVAIFYGADRSHAHMFAAEYNRRMAGNGKLMVVLTGEDTARRVKEVIDQVRSGEITAIANSMLLVEGFDVPKIGLVVNSPVGSMVKALQQAGRMQRLDPDLPADSPEQTSFVLDTYYRVNGKVVGRPRFVFEALGDSAIARTVEGRTRHFSEVARIQEKRGARGERRTPASTASLPVASFAISSEVETVVRMLKHRDGLAAQPDRAPAKEDDMMSLFDILKAVRPPVEVRSRIFNAFFAVESSWRGTGSASLDDDVFEGGLRTENGRTFFCLSEGAARSLAEICGTTFYPSRPIREGDLSFNALAAEIGVSVTDRKLRALWASLDAEMRMRRTFMLPDGPLGAALVDDGASRFVVVPTEDASRIRNVVVLPETVRQNRDVVTPPPEPVPQVRDIVVPEIPVTSQQELETEFASICDPAAAPWEPGYLCRWDTEDMHGFMTASKNFDAWKKLVLDFESGDGPGLRVAWMTKDGASQYFLHADDVPDFVARYFSDPRKSRFDDDLGQAKYGSGLSWPLPERLTFSEACLALDTQKRGSKAFVEAWRRCTEAWKSDEPAVLHGFEIRGFPATDGVNFLIEKSCLVDFSKLASFIELEPLLSDESVLPASPRITFLQFWVCIGGSEENKEVARTAFLELERSWRASGVASIRGVDFPEARRDLGSDQFTIARADATRLAQAIDRQIGIESPDGRATLIDVRRRLGLVTHEPLLDRLWGELRFFLKSRGNEFTKRPVILSDGEKLGGFFTRLAPYRSGQLTVSTDDIDRIGQHLEAGRREIPEWTPDYIGKPHIGSLIDGSFRGVTLNRAWDMLTRASTGELGDIRAGEMRKRKSVRFFLHFDDIAKFQERFVLNAETERRAEKGAGRRKLQESSDVPAPRM